MLLMRDKLNQLLEEALNDFSEDDYSAALNRCKRILDAEPDHVDALYLAGLCLGHIGNRPAGIEWITRAMLLKPALVDYDNMRDVLIQRGINDEMEIREELYFQYRLFQSVDAFLISYPKCGRTWLRMLLGKYVIGESGVGDPLEILELTSANPDFRTLDVSHDDYPQLKRADKIFTNKQAYAGKKVIFLARDPRDVLVSYYFQYTKRGAKRLANDREFNGTPSEFVRHEIGGLRSLVAFYNVWAKNRSVPADFLLVTYEDMIKDARTVLLQVVAFLGWPMRGDAWIKEIVAFGSFDNMRKLEETNALNNARLQAPDNRDPESYKVRKGKVGGYMDYLLEEDKRYIDDYLQHNLDDYFSVYKQVTARRLG